jgi:GntR family transcriptional regulator
MTARQAIDVLKAEGLVRSEHGRGVFVRDRPRPLRLARNRPTRSRQEAMVQDAYSMQIKRMGLQPRVELIEFEVGAPPPAIAERLRLKAGQAVVLRRHHMYVNSRPMQLATFYVPRSFAEGTRVVERDIGPGGICSRLAEVGHRLGRFSEEVATRMPTPEEARFLRIMSPQPVLNLFRTAFDDAGTPIEVSEQVMSGDRWVLTYEWAAG